MIENPFITSTKKTDDSYKFEPKLDKEPVKKEVKENKRIVHGDSCYDTAAFLDWEEAD